MPRDERPFTVKLRDLILSQYETDDTISKAFETRDYKHIFNDVAHDGCGCPQSYFFNERAGDD